MATHTVPSTTPARPPLAPDATRPRSGLALIDLDDPAGLALGIALLRVLRSAYDAPMSGARVSSAARGEQER